MDTTTNKEPENLSDFLNSLASALLAWQGVENNLFLIFNFLVGPHKNPAVLSAIYHSVVNIEPRRKMVNAAAAIVLKDHPFLKEWDKLSEQIRKKSGSRNNLAHFGLVSHTGVDGKTTALLKPSIFNVKANPNAEYNVKHIDEWHTEFNHLSAELSAFLGKLIPTLQS